MSWERCNECIKIAFIKMFINNESVIFLVKIIIKIMLIGIMRFDVDNFIE